MLFHIGTTSRDWEFPKMKNPSRALLQATLIRLSVLMNPGEFSELLRTVERMMIFASSPWKLSLISISDTEH